VALNIWKRVILLIVLIMPTDTQKVPKPPTPGATITPPNYTGPQWSNLSKELGLGEVKLRPEEGNGKISLTGGFYTAGEAKKNVHDMASAIDVSRSRDFLKEHPNEVFFVSSSGISLGIFSLDLQIDRLDGNIGYFKISGKGWEPIDPNGEEWKRLEFYEKGRISKSVMSRFINNEPLLVQINLDTTLPHLRQGTVLITGIYDPDESHPVCIQTD
jgi:hypothetical protein